MPLKIKQKDIDKIVNEAAANVKKTSGYSVPMDFASESLINRQINNTQLAKNQAEQAYYNNLYSQQAAQAKAYQEAQAKAKNTTPASLKPQTDKFSVKVDTSKTNPNVTTTVVPVNTVKTSSPNTTTTTVYTGKSLDVGTPAIKNADKEKAPVLPDNPTPIAEAPVYEAPAYVAPTYEAPVQTVEKPNPTVVIPTYTTNITREKPQFTQATEEQRKAIEAPRYTATSYTPTTVSAATASFQPSQDYYDAMAETQRMLNELKSGRTSYTDRINSGLQAIENTDPFSYDFNSDPMFQQMLSGAMKSGKLAMEDAMGQAAALTGGYGSSYSGTVGQQAYNRYIDEAYDRIPDYWGMAMSEYQQDLNNKYNKLNQYMALDDTEWNRGYNTFNSQYKLASDQYDREFNDFWQEQNFNEDSRRWAESENDARRRFAEQIRQADNTFDYQQYRDAIADARYEDQTNYSRYRDDMEDYYRDLGLDYTSFRDAVGDAQWLAQFDRGNYESDRNFDRSVYESDRDYSNDSALAWANYNLNKDKYKTSKDQWEAEYALNLAKAEESANGSSGSTKLTDPSETQMTRALEAYATGGWDAVEDYVAKLPDTVNIDKIFELIKQRGSLNYSIRDYDLTNDTINWMGGLNNNNQITDPSTGKVYTLSEMAKLIAEQEGISLEEAKKKLYKYN